MAESRQYGIGSQLNIEQILLEAQHRWLRSAEICEILQNYKKFVIAPEPPQLPPSGSLFLFDRKVLRYFRKDGHNWRKKKDGKTVKEAHERLKAGSVDVLHCYYAHGEENENFQRRSYWLLEEDRSNIVLVHYREVKASRANFNRGREPEVEIPVSMRNEETVLQPEGDSSASSKIYPNRRGTSQTTDTNLNGAQASEYEDVESAYGVQVSSGFQSLPQRSLQSRENIDSSVSAPYYPMPFSDNYQGNPSIDPGMKFVQAAGGDNTKNRSHSTSPLGPQSPSDFPSCNNTGFNPQQALTDGFVNSQGNGTYIYDQQGWQASEVISPEVVSNLPMDLRDNPYSTYNVNKYVNSFGISASCDPAHIDSNKYPQNASQMQLRSGEGEQGLKPEQEIYVIDGKANYSPLRKPWLDGLQKEGLKKLNSFERWMNKELGDVNESIMQSNTGGLWETVASEDVVNDSSIASQVHLDTYVQSPSISQGQLFSIIDFSPNWAYAGSEIKVIITGRFLKSQQDLEKCKWSCMFGEVEVPAIVISDGVLHCHTPVHKAGRIPFYITCSNRLACSEVQEFEYKDYNVDDLEIPDVNNDEVLHMRFEQLLSIDSTSCRTPDPSFAVENSSFIINLLMKSINEWELFVNNSDISPEIAKAQQLQNLWKEKLHEWLLHKIAEGGKGPSVWDEGGQGVLHFAAALGYDWVIRPTVTAGVSINFRDVNGWTALHWAASCGRERMVGLLISLAAAPGAITDPSPRHPSGRTPADLASNNGHKGIAGYLAESSLSSHLSTLELDSTRAEAGETSGGTAVQLVSEEKSTPITDGDFPEGHSLKDSLAAVRNSIQAAARIHQVFRVKSFQRKQMKEYVGKDLGISDGALSLITARKSKLGHNDQPHVAAIRIQNKFRSWKGRKDFLTIRQQIVKIQAHVRGYQVRKNYKKITWSVGILEKVILRWRRKGSGLRGFKRESIKEANGNANISSNEDDDDFLKEGRKQTEERLQRALCRVKSMVQYPEARDQYSRLLNVVSEMQVAKAVYEDILNSTDGWTGLDDDDVINLDRFLHEDDDDTLMPTVA